MLTVVKKNEQEMLDFLATEAGFLTGIAHYDNKPLKLDPYQISFLKNRSKYRSVVKSRQVGFSFLFACEALARCHLRDSHTSNFVSYNLGDAKEKINYARQLHDELPLAFRKKLVVDSKTELAFEANGASKRISRIISNPSKAPRGKKGDIYLDEFAHYSDDREVYKGSTALILRSKSQFTTCSSPLGRRGVFWEISEQEVRKYPAYTRQRVPWWLCSFFCTDVVRASKEAPGMTTEERVRTFGTKGIQDQFDSLLLEDFQQEFELHFCDESYSFFPYDLILSCTRDSLRTYNDYAAFPPSPTGRLTAGFDVGRKHDLSELTVLETRDETVFYRMNRSFDKVPFEEQEADLDNLLNTLPVAWLAVDQSGLGIQLCENLQRRHGIYIRPETFTAAKKEIWCNDLKILMQKRTLVLPKDRTLIAQIHSIKKTQTGVGRPKFESERYGDQKGHADKFWSLALACQKERFLPTNNEHDVDLSVRVFG